MLISTSRKPSSKTRAFCKNLSHALDTDYVNRGKMSMRELQLKSNSLGLDNIVLVYEMKGNPSKITFFSNDGEELLVILGSVNTTNQRLHIKTSELSFKSEIPELDVLSDIFPINDSNDNYNENHIYVEKLEDYDDEYDDIEDFNKRIGIIHFYNRDGNDTGLKINIRKIID
ncbi:MAG: ribonucleotide-diphosphate reductase subunit beta [Methanobrevibacter arboriphilus]|uniref:Probable Brix domain-containing ribosomal biogenesis protein n=1 Tax=Methanobrevibacter arboriphilus TaxID=39441 RepID=A0A843AS08_METAZ|nr:ribonucleotide-diphosphate reductase subunit beta [Methanobrevibacter arboriphilus]MBF4469510.1 ribonucleotide-diphosphate reductase subunit beta [Methanobrevibacter arboriphilus]